MTDVWTIGAGAVGATGIRLLGDEANATPVLPAYLAVHFSTSYQLDPHVQLFAWAENVSNARYYTFGTFSPTSSVALAQAPGASNSRSFSPAAPFGGFGGVRVTF